MLNCSDCSVVKKSKVFYVKLVKFKCNIIKSMDMCPNLHMYIQRDMSVEDAFRNQLCSKIEIKLREFSFKVMYGILACNSNLKKWRIKESYVCDICNSKQTIEHLLFECHRAVNLWNLFEDAYQITMNFSNIVCGFKDYDLVFNQVVTLLSYLLYKEWLLKSVEYKARCLDFPYRFYISELKLRQQIYFKIGLVLPLDPIINALEGMDDM